MTTETTERKAAEPTSEPNPELADLGDLGELRVAAQRLMPEAYRDFVNNVGMEETLSADLAAWERILLRPRALVDVSEIDTAVTVLGQEIAVPVITAPFVGSTFVHPEGEVATARGAVAAGSITTLSMTGTRAPEQVGAVAAGRYWQQLYCVRDRSIVKDVVDRAVATGAVALCLTVDLPVMPSFSPPMRRASEALGELWRTDAHAMYIARDYADRPFGAAFPDPGVSWSDIEWLRSLSELPLILKASSVLKMRSSPASTARPP